MYYSVEFFFKKTLKLCR